MNSGDIPLIEKEMLENIYKAQRFTALEADELYYAYKYINAQGIAAKTDVEEIARLGIPIYQELSALKSLSIEDIDALLFAGSITSEEIKAAFFRISQRAAMPRP